MSWQRGCRNVFSDNEFLSVCKLCETFDQCLSNVSMKHWKTSKFHCREISTKRCCLSCAPMISLNFCFERKKIPGPSHSLKVFQTKATANKDLKFEILNSCRSIAVRWFFCPECTRNGESFRDGGKTRFDLKRRPIREICIWTVLLLLCFHPRAVWLFSTVVSHSLVIATTTSLSSGKHKRLVPKLTGRKFHLLKAHS